MLNRVTLIGRLTEDPSLRSTQSDIKVCTFTLACQRDFKSADGERATDFIDIVAWRSTAEFVSRYFSKGRLCCVDGRIQVRQWLDGSGNKRRSFEIVADSVHFADSRPQAQQEQPPYAPAAAYAPVAAGAARGGYGGDDLAAGGDLPF